MLMLAIVLTAVAMVLVLGAVRESVIAGTWYPGTESALKREVTGYLNNADVPGDIGAPRAVIVPHAGYSYSGACAGYAYATLRGASYERVVLLGPSHRVALGGVAVGDYEAYETPLGKVPLDEQACASLVSRGSPFVRDNRAHQHEHSLEIQLPFLQETLGSFRLVPLVVQGVRLEAARAASDGLAEIVDEKTLVVVSSDFTHYGAPFGYLPFSENVPENLRKLDMEAADQVVRGDVEGFVDYCDRTGVTICGREPIAMLMCLAQKVDLGRPRLLHYTTSGQSTGDWSHVVSYVSIGYVP